MPEYDDAGNMLSGPRPGDSETLQHYRYDAWGWLVGVYEDDEGVAGKYAAGEEAYALTVYKNRPSFRISDGTNVKTVTTTATIPTGRWVHLAAVFDAGTSMTIYVNGVVAASVTDAIPAGIYDSSAALVIGMFDEADGWDGRIDDVRVYSRPLSDKEIAALAGGNGEYDGLNRRIVHGRSDYYYNEGWQVLQECQDGDMAHPYAQYVWDPVTVPRRVVEVVKKRPLCRFDRCVSRRRQGGQDGSLHVAIGRRGSPA